MASELSPTIKKTTKLGARSSGEYEPNLNSIIETIDNIAIIKYARDSSCRTSLSFNSEFFLKNFFICASLKIYSYVLRLARLWLVVNPKIYYWFINLIYEVYLITHIVFVYRFQVCNNV